MAAPMLCELIDDLPNSANKTEDLEKIKLLLGQINRRALGDIVGNISFNVIFECLDTNEEEQLSACCGILELLLNAVDVSVLLAQFHDDLLQGLGHISQTVQLLCLRQAQRVADSNPQGLSRQSDVLQHVITIIGQDSLQVAKQAAIILITLGGSPDTMELLFQGSSLDGLHALADGSDDVKFRSYELITDISRLSPDNLVLCSGSGLLQKLVNEVHKDDVLVQLNAIELLARLATAPHGLAFMEEQGIVAKLDQMLQSVHEDPMVGFLMPALVKFFGGVAFLQPKEVCQRHPNFVPMLFHLCEDGEVSSGALGAESLGMLGSSVEGKNLLSQHGSSMRMACKKMGALLKDPSNDIKVRILGAVEKLLRISVPEQTSDLLSLAESWYSSMASDPMVLLLDLLEKPFNDVRCGVYKVLLAIASQAWAQSQFRDHATFKEFLLNRSTESIKEGKELKFQIVKELVEAPTTAEVMGRVYFVKLKEYVREGPFFVLAESAVAMENE